MLARSSFLILSLAERAASADTSLFRRVNGFGSIRWMTKSARHTASCSWAIPFCHRYCMSCVQCLVHAAMEMGHDNDERYGSLFYLPISIILGTVLSQSQRLLQQLDRPDFLQQPNHMVSACVCETSSGDEYCCCTRYRVNTVHSKRKV